VHLHTLRTRVRRYALESIYYSKFSEKSDVWSFGITAWEVLMWGRKPYGKVKGAQVVTLLQEVSVCVCV
jgi:hypothetical protein